MALSKYDSVSEAVASGDRAEILRAQADKLSKAIDESTSDRDLSSLNLRMIQILQELEVAAPQKKDTAADKHKAKRTRTKPGAKPDDK